MHPRTCLAPIGVAALFLAGSLTALAETVPSRPMTLDQVVTAALAKHPRIRSGEAQERVTDARVDETRTSRLPGVGVSAQVNRSTGNTPPGAWFSTTGFPPIAGAPRGKTLDSGTWQTGASLWANWDVLAFERQAAAIDAALAARSEASAVAQADRLQVAYEAADAFVQLVEAQETVRAATASVDRAQVLVSMTQPLVQQSLRPGADAARAQAELAAAQTVLARTEQTRDVRRARLAEAMGDASLHVEVDPGRLAEAVDDIPAQPTVPSPNHPDIARTNAEVARAQQQQAVVAVEYLPRLDLVAALWARGSGYLQSPADGLVPDIPNWATGAVVTWSLFDIPAIRARARVASAATDSAAALRDETYLAVAAQLSSATAVLQGAQRVAKQTPATLASARAAEQQIVARYRAGLAPVVDVADAERLLLQAEIDDAVARLEVRRALLAVARAAGDLGPFLAAARGRS
jgi:outer membrane protein TolC